MGDHCCPPRIQRTAVWPLASHTAPRSHCSGEGVALGVCGSAPTTWSEPQAPLRSYFAHGGHCSPRSLIWSPVTSHALKSEVSAGALRDDMKECSASLWCFTQHLCRHQFHCRCNNHHFKDKEMASTRLAQPAFTQRGRGEATSWTSDHECITPGVLSTTPGLLPGEKINHTALLFAILSLRNRSRYTRKWLRDASKAMNTWRVLLQSQEPWNGWRGG